MCLIRNVPITGRYQNEKFGNEADFCMVGVINAINAEEDCVTVASCCGHGNLSHIPYITVVMPQHRIPEIKQFLIEVLGWDVASVSVWNELPDFFLEQLGSDWLTGKVYAGFYNMADQDNSDLDFCYTWRVNDFQVA